VNLDEFRARPSGVKPAKTQRPPRHRGDAWFIKGPLPGWWMERAAELPGASLHVALALWYLAGVGRTRKVKPTWTVWRRFGTSPDAARRGLAALERARLISVERGPGRCPLVTMLDASERPFQP
jgi:hypothetical protein